MSVLKMGLQGFHVLTVSWVLPDVGHLDEELMRARLRHWRGFADQFGLLPILDTLDYGGAHCKPSKQG